MLSSTRLRLFTHYNQHNMVHYGLPAISYGNMTVDALEHLYPSRHHSIIDAHAQSSLISIPTPKHNSHAHAYAVAVTLSGQSIAETSTVDAHTALNLLVLFVRFVCFFRLHRGPPADYFIHYSNPLTSIPNNRTASHAQNCMVPTTPWAQ